MNKISCDVCMDLLPLVQDGIVSGESNAAVQLHMESCPACKAAFAGPLPAPGDGTQDLFQKLRRRGTLYGLIAILCVLCLAGSAVLATRFAEQKRDERRYMANFFAAMTHCGETARYVAAAQGAPDEMFYLLRFQLQSLDDALLDGYYYVSDSVPSVAGWWFMAGAANLGNSLSPDGQLTEQTNAIALQLHEDLEAMLEKMTGPDGMNLDPELDMEGFCRIIFDFYRSLDRQY